ncbi:DinB family protein [Mesorhizobium sp. L2C089B000]
MMSRQEMLTHVVTHGGYHRGEIGRILMQIGIAPPGYVCRPPPPSRAFAPAAGARAGWRLGPAPLGFQGIAASREEDSPIFRFPFPLGISCAEAGDLPSRLGDVRHTTGCPSSAVFPGFHPTTFDIRAKSSCLV